MPNEMTPKETAEILDIIAESGSTIGMDCSKAMEASEYAASQLRKIASGELGKAPIRCIDCEYSLPMDMKKYPDLTCHLCGGNLRVRVDMSCPCAKRPEKEDNNETD